MFGYINRLCGLTDNAGDADLVGRLLGGELQDRREQAVVADFELRRVYAGRDAACAGGDVVAGQRALALLVEFAVRGEGEWMRRDYGAFTQMVAPGHLMNDIAHSAVGVEHARPCPGESPGLKQGRACSTPTLIRQKPSIFKTSRLWFQNASACLAWRRPG